MKIHRLEHREDLEDQRVDRVAPGKQTRIAALQMKAGAAPLPTTGSSSAPATQPLLGPLLANHTGGRHAAVLRQMESSFGEDFSSVKLHEDNRAAAVGALAYTQGEDIHFKPGQLAPETEAGRALIGHELAHVVQQRRGRVAATRSKAGVPVNDEVAFESEADSAGAAAARGEAVSLSATSAKSSAGGAIAVQRAPDEGADEGALGECPDPGLGGAGPTPSNAKSGVDWGAVLDHPGWGFARAGLEVTRFVPIAGMFGGMAADVIEGAQNMHTGAQTDSEWMQMGLILRQGVVFINNVMGHVMYLGELCQDAAIASVLGVELEIVVAPADEALAIFKAVLQGTQTVADLAILTGAVVGQENTVVGSTEWEAYRSIASGFVLDAALDGVGAMTAIADVWTAGLANGEVVKTVAKSAFSLTSLGNQLIKGIYEIGQSWVSIWGGGMIEKGLELPEQQKSAEGMSAAEASPVILGELGLMAGVHQSGGELIGAGAEQIDSIVGQLREFQAGAVEGREPFAAFREALVGGLGQFEDRLTALTEAEALATSAELETAMLLGKLDAAVAVVGGLRVPALSLPEHTEIGDNPLADVIERGIDKGAEVGNSGLAEVQSRLQRAIDRIVLSVTTDLRPHREQLELMATFIATFKGLVAEQIAFVRDSIAKLRESIAAAEEPADLIDALIAEVAEMLGLESDFDLGSLQAEWANLGRYIADLRGWAGSLS